MPSPKHTASEVPARQGVPEKPAVPADIALVRDGARTLIAQALEKAHAARDTNASDDSAAASDYSAAASVLERTIYNASVRVARTTHTPHRQAYTSARRLVTQMLARQVGPYPDDVMAVMYLTGRKTADEIVAESLAPAALDPVDPRETIRRLFVRILLRASPVFAKDRERALETARAIEIACYNRAVRASKESEEPPRRQWDSTLFVDIYSTRCGTIAGLLDPASEACRAYGATLVDRLLADGSDPQGVEPLRPEELGGMTSKELCPQATAAEVAGIQRRANQVVVRKESNLFRCPHCGERKSSYNEVQRRGLDESPDYFCECLACHRHFAGHPG